MFVAAPAMAVVYEPTWKGYVTGIDYETSTITVELTEIYGCEYIDEADPICGFEAADPQEISGEVSDDVYHPTAYDLITIGSPVIGKSFGGFESTQWSAFAKISEEDTIYIEALYGDPSLLDIVPLTGGYAVSFTDMIPDCDACTGTVCPAKSVFVHQYSDGTETVGGTLEPGQGFGGTGDPMLFVAFFSGETSYLACETDSTTTEMMIGPQPVQDFQIFVMPLDQTSEEPVDETVE